MHAAIANAVPTIAQPQNIDRYARCIETSKRIRWDIDRDVIRGRSFDFGKKFLPDGLSKVDQLAFLQPAEARLLSQIQGRTYANMFALVERFIGAKTTELGRDHALGDQVAFEALVRLTDEELKHQEMFRRLERMAAVGMPVGYSFLPQPDEVAGAVLSKSNWAVLALTLDIELFSQAHYRSSIEPDDSLSRAVEGRVPVPLEGRVAACRARRARVAPRGRAPHRRRARPRRRRADRAGRRGRRHLPDAGQRRRRLLPLDAAPPVRPGRGAAVHAVVLKAYRWQYVVSGAQEPRFQQVLKALVTPAQMQRILHALAPFFADA